VSLKTCLRPQENQRISDTAPFKLVKTDPTKAQSVIADLVEELHFLALILNPFIPGTSEKIEEAIVLNRKPENLFPRLP
jgi:methionyl-tRNA synthetase